MAFTNTVDTVGDAALIRSIIDKSITELNCNITTSIRQYTFHACAKLTNMNFPNCTSVSNNAFYGCSALAKANFASPVAFADNAFYGCTSLTALILRSTDQLCTITDTTFASSAIASGTGYIYVPAALVDQYKASWTAYANQIRAIEDYPEVCDPYSWVAVAKAIDNGTYATVYKIGDLVPLDMGYSAGAINMQIAGFDVDDLADGTGKAPISWISKELMPGIRRVNPQVASTTDDSGNVVYTDGTGGIGGWGNSELRRYMQETILPKIPDEARRLIKTVKKTQPAYDTTGAGFTQTTEDDVWIPANSEVSGNNSLYYALFQNANANRKKPILGYSGAVGWYLRNATTVTGHGSYGYVNESGSLPFAGIPAQNQYNPCLCFCT